MPIIEPIDGPAALVNPNHGIKSAPTHGSRETPSTTISGDSGIFPQSKESQTFVDLIVQSFSPVISVHTSIDTDNLVRRKNIYGGLCALLRPFGEQVEGHVTVRHSKGLSKSFHDFGIRFVPFPLPERHTSGTFDISIESAERPQEDCENVDPNLKAEGRGLHWSLRNILKQRISEGDDDGNILGSLYPHFLQKTLCGGWPNDSQSLSQPIACIIAVSSQNATPIETFRELYDDIQRGNNKVPAWVCNELLRYYVLVHDDDYDDVTKSTSLFNLMKRHFGLHCHLLRVRGKECGPSDQDQALLPPCKWLTAEEELLAIRWNKRNGEPQAARKSVYDTDAAAIRTFVRELITQSIVPFMEARVALWNDQVASRKRGLSGRFMSLSKKWAGLGPSRGTSPGPASNLRGAGTPDSSSENLHAADTGEATMYRLGEFALMLRDWQLASSTYDILRNDFLDDKAGFSFAHLNELAAFSTLLIDQDSGHFNADVVDQMIDTAVSSYLVRCADPSRAFRCLIIVVELYIAHGPRMFDEAVKWASRILEVGVLNISTQALLAARIALGCASGHGLGCAEWGSRYRHLELWGLLATKIWTILDRRALARGCFNMVTLLLSSQGARRQALPFDSMQEAWAILEETIMARGRDASYISTVPLGSYEGGDEEIEDLQEGGPIPSLQETAVCRDTYSSDSFTDYRNNNMVM